MKRSLFLIVLFFSLTHISIAQRSLSLFAKGNFGLENIQQKTLSSTQAEIATLRFQAFDLAFGPTSKLKIRVRPAFEIGVKGSFVLNERFNFIFGLNLQQVRVESILKFQSTIDRQTSLSHLYYLKIPLLVEFDLYKDRIFLQAGIYAASKIAYHHKELDRKASNIFVFETTSSSFGRAIDSSDLFNSLLFGFQTGIKYQFWKKFSIDMNYSHSLNNFFDEDTFIDMNLNVFSVGLQWQFM